MDEVERVCGSGRICQCSKSLHEGVEASVLLVGECFRRFEVAAEQRQSCPLLLILYSVYVMEMLKDLEPKRLVIDVEGTFGVVGCCM